MRTNSTPRKSANSWSSKLFLTTLLAIFSISAFAHINPVNPWYIGAQNLNVCSDNSRVEIGLAVNASFASNSIETIDAEVLSLQISFGDSLKEGMINIEEYTVLSIANNANNPAGNTFATYNPAVTVTAQLTNQQYNYSPIPENGCVFFSCAAAGVY